MKPHQLVSCFLSFSCEILIWFPLATSLFVCLFVCYIKKKEKHVTDNLDNILKAQNTCNGKFVVSMLLHASSPLL